MHLHRLTLVEDHLTVNGLYFVTLSHPVPEKGGSGLNGVADLYHCIPVLPSGGRTVL